MSHNEVKGETPEITANANRISTEYKIHRHYCRLLWWQHEHQLSSVTSSRKANVKLITWPKRKIMKVKQLEQTLVRTNQQKWLWTRFQYKFTQR
jgi:hypothetical protein